MFFHILDKLASLSVHGVLWKNYRPNQCFPPWLSSFRSRLWLKFGYQSVYAWLSMTFWKSNLNKVIYISLIILSWQFSQFLLHLGTNNPKTAISRQLTYISISLSNSVISYITFGTPTLILCMKLSITSNTIANIINRFFHVSLFYTSHRLSLLLNHKEKFQSSISILTLRFFMP